MDYLKENGVTSGLINLGGNVLAIGEKEDQSPWKIGIQKPFEAPHELKDFLAEKKAIDSSNRDYSQELAAAAPLPCHHVPGQELPEKSLAYRWGKRHYFFGFGAYG